MKNKTFLIIYTLISSMLIGYITYITFIEDTYKTNKIINKLNKYSIDTIIQNKNNNTIYTKIYFNEEYCIDATEDLGFPYEKPHFYYTIKDIKGNIIISEIASTKKNQNKIKNFINIKLKNNGRF